MIALISLTIFPLILEIFMGNMNNAKRKKIFLILCGIAIAFVMGFRSRYTGTRDTEMYGITFDSLKWSNVGLIEYLRQSMGTNVVFSELGFSAYIWVIAKVFPSYRYLLIFTAIMNISLTMRFIYKYSKNALLSVIMFVCLGLFTFNMNGLRQCIAMSICLLAYDFIEKKKFIPFLLVVILAMSFHKSAIFFALTYFIIFMKPKWNYTMFFVGLLVLFVLFADNLTIIYDALTSEDYSGAESFDSGGVVTILIYTSVIVFALISKDKIRKGTAFNCILLSLVGLILYLARFFSVQIYERVSYYFYYFVILLLPSAINTYEIKSQTLINTVVIILSIALFVYRIQGGAFSDFTLVL
ncbi:MAG: EpsG family protein [Clostridia bacterium]|nr:EpsG family protein [Clostridia bacterium]